MDSYAHSKEKALQVDLPSFIGLYPDEPIKSIAVLFTDIVGSTEYFKKYGDKSGRAMLKEHYNIATPIINEYNGKVIKALGDSVMASFISPLEALKSAIKIQQQSCKYNETKGTQDQILVRIGLHYGDVIVEEKDIFGDVVNVAAKLTKISEGNQIYISGEMHKLIKDELSVNFELVNYWDKKNIPVGLAIYKVAWDLNVDLTPAVYVTLLLKPLWKLCESDFNEIWDNLLKAKDELWKGDIKNEHIFSDKSLMLTMKESVTAFNAAEHALKFLKEGILNTSQDTFVPVKIIIDVSSSLSEEKIKNKGMDDNWQDINPGAIYISSDAYEVIKKYMDIPATSILRRLAYRVFYKVLSDEKEHEENASLFMYKQKINTGEFSPCYYCGSKQHRAVHCPSKKLPEITHALEGLGYFSIEDINEYFYKYLTSEKIDFDMPETMDDYDPDKSIALTHFGLFELKRIFQLRFFRTIWDSKTEEWNKVKENKGENDGGMVWLAQDLLRVSDLDRAESILKETRNEHPMDYRVYCASGFLHIERENLNQAEHYFNLALQYTNSVPQKIFIMFLLFRISMLNNDYNKAHKTIRKIFQLNSLCIDAIYQDIILRFHEKNENLPIQRLIKLIQDNRIYYVYALIDPDLAPYSDIINPELKKLLDTAKENAKLLLHEAEEELDRSKKALDASGFSETQSLLFKTKKLLESEGYFSYLDAISHSNMIISTCKKYIKVRKKILFDQINQLNNRIESCMDFIKKYRYPRLVKANREQANVVLMKLHQLLDTAKSVPWEKFKEIEAFTRDLSNEINQLEISLERLDFIQHSLIYFVKFLKKTAILLSIVFSVGLIALPFIISAVSKLDVGTNGVWFYQKAFIIAGGIISICISLFITVKHIMRDD